MRILYGVQGTGNGHITRARSMARAFAETDIRVDYLFSGRPADKFFSMEPFGACQYRRGLTLNWHDGRLDYFRTLLKNNLLQLIDDIRSLDLEPYDLVITDFEPVTAWAARLGKTPCLGISHQYAFKYRVPIAGKNLASTMLMKYFAPADRCLGFHWHHFNGPILPPLIEKPGHELSIDRQKILVYLPFESLGTIMNWLRPVNSHDFFIYHELDRAEDDGHLHLRPFDRAGFNADLANCGGVIANAGFGLSSEAIQCGKKLLVKPMQGQMEQLSNAAALNELGLGMTMSKFDIDILKDWLCQGNPPQHRYPCVATALVDWIRSGFRQDPMELARSLWQSTQARI